MGVSRAEVIALIPSLFLPFTLLKAVMNSAVIMILYKPISVALKAAKVLPKNELMKDVSAASAEDGKKKNLIFSLVVSCVSVAIIVLCVLIFVFVMHGRFEIV